MADDTKPSAGNSTIQRNPSQTPGAGIGAQPVNPQNVNNSPSPGGDGVQSSASERSAAGLDPAVNQPAQNRVNAAERREQTQRTDGKAGLRAGIVQSPGEVLPGEASANAINAAEQNRLARQEADHLAQFGDLPQSTLDEMEAGRNALKRHAQRAAPVTPAKE